MVALTEDHKPSLEEERIRIEQAGGFVRFDRVNGELAMSRAIGDFRYKTTAGLELHEHPVICLPDIAIQQRSPEDESLLLACDGVWDVISNEEASHPSHPNPSHPLLTPPIPSPLSLFSPSLQAVQFVNNIVLNGEGEGDRDSSSSEESSGEPERKKPAHLFDTPSPSRERRPVTAQEAAESLIDLALRDGSTDNISALVVRFPRH